jgi:hypothetical protein
MSYTANNVSCLSKYRADVDEYAQVIVHSISPATGVTLCGRRPVASKNTRWERTHHDVTCLACRRSAAKKS